jgi:hypothetical protein
MPAGCLCATPGSEPRASRGRPGETRFPPRPAAARLPRNGGPGAARRNPSMQRCMDGGPESGHSRPCFLSLRATVDWSTPSATAMRDWLL